MAFVSGRVTDSAGRTRAPGLIRASTTPAILADSWQGRAVSTESLPPGNGRSVYAHIWLIPGTVAAAAITGAVLRW